MKQLQKISDISVEDLADYLRIDELTTDESATLATMLEAAKAYIMHYTGRTLEELDNYADIVIVALVLIEDMYDNRTMYVDSGSVNTVVQSILGMHSVNLL